MIIKNLWIRQSAKQHSLEADVVYENSDKGSHTIFFEVPAEFKAYLLLSYEAFLFAAFPAALYHREERIKIEGSICPEAVMNVLAAMRLQSRWFESNASIPRVEYEKEEVQPAGNEGVSACFLSGGVDSLSNFCRNAKIYSQNHQQRYKAALLVYGMDLGDPNKPAREDIFKKTILLLKKFTTQHDCQLVPVYTNARELEEGWVFYEQRHFGPLMAGVVHSLGKKINNCTIAMDQRVDFYMPHGSHPFLNKYFSSSYIDMHSILDALMRIEKYEFIKKLSGALDVLRVCYELENVEEDQINCGQCSKCMRTKLELYALGLLDQVSTFPKRKITLKDIENFRLLKSWDAEWFIGLISVLKKKGETKIAKMLQKEYDHPTGEFFRAEMGT